MYNILKYSSNYSDTTSSLRFYCKDESTTINANITNNVAFKPFVCKTKQLGETEAQSAPNNNNNGILENAKIAAPLKYLSNIWRSLEMS